MAIVALEEGRAEVENQYTRAVSRDGNASAQRLVGEVFEVCDRSWRGLGTIPASGYRLRDAFARHDAERLFEVGAIEARESRECMAGDVLRGRARPSSCPAFGTRCTPERPLGAPMVSSEGACATYFRYRRVP
jgi:hydrogenase expression/formation protein HypD